MNIDFQMNTVCNFLRENALSCEKSIIELDAILSGDRSYNYTFYLKDEKRLTIRSEHFTYNGWSPFVINMNGITFYIDPQASKTKRHEILNGFFRQIDAIANELYRHNNNKNFLKMFR